MKTYFPIFAALMVAFFSMSAKAQTQEEQQSCMDDVYALCGQDVPDRDRITACLRKRWREVSADCRSVMANYGRHDDSRNSSRKAPAQR